MKENIYNNTLPIHTKDNRTYLGVILSFLVFILNFITFCYFIFTNNFNNVSKGNDVDITIEIPFQETEDSKESSLQIHEKKIEIIKKKIESLQGIKNVKLVGDERLKLLVSSISGANIAESNFKLPTLIDLFLNDGNNFDYDSLVYEMLNISPDVRVVRHKTIVNRIENISESIRVISFCVLSFILFSILIITLLVIRSALHTSKETLDILRLMGAKNSYISKIYQKQIFKASLIGSFSGVVLSSPLTYFFTIFLNKISVVHLTTLKIITYTISISLIVQIIILLLSQIVTIFTVSSILKKMNLKKINK